MDVYPTSTYPYGFKIPCGGSESIEVFVTSELTTYKVEFDSQGIEFKYTDNDTYTILDRQNNRIVLPPDYPNRDGYVFDGWKIGSDNNIYKPNAEVMVDAVRSYADANGVLTFTACWKGLGEYVNYTVETYWQTRDEDGNYSYSVRADETSEELQALNDTVVTARAEQTTTHAGKNYILDTTHENSATKKIISKTGTDNVLRLYYALDENQNNKPDEEELVKLTFYSIVYHFVDSTADYIEVKNLVPSLPMPTDLPEALDTDDDGVVFVGWSDGKTISKDLPTVVPSQDTEYTAVYYVDKNNNGKPDVNETRITITFKSDRGFADENDQFVSGPITVTDLEKMSYTVPKPWDTNDDGVVFIGWNKDDDDANVIETLTGIVPDTNTVYTAVYADDKNNNGKRDDKEDLVTIIVESPYGFEGNSSTLPEWITEADMLPGTELNVPTPKAWAEGFMFVGWDTADGTIPTLVPDKDTTYTALYKEDRNHNGTPDEEETKVTLTFVSENGFEKNEGTTFVLKDQLPGVEFTGPVPADTDTDGVVFTGWNTEDGKLPTVVPEKNTTYTAQYAADKNNNGTADAKEKKITLTFVSDHGFKGQESNSYVLKDLLSGMPFTAPVPEDTDTDGVKFAGWDTEDGTLPAAVPTSDTTYTAKYVDDKNNNGIDDATEKKVTITFVSEHGFDGAESPYVLENQLPGTELTAPVPTDTNTDKVVFMGWDTEDGKVPALVPAEDTTYTAQYDRDKNNNGISDKNETWETSDNTPEITTDQSKYSYIVGIDGDWKLVSEENKIWNFVLKNGSIVKDRWVYIKNPYASYGQPESGWFFFENDGKMAYGWYLDTKTGDWYVLHSTSDGMLGTMLTGWYDDKQDGERYYLDPVTGKMKTGWQNINGKWYYFNTYAPEPTWTYNGITWNHNGSAGKPYGAMYRNETTPDGYYVGADGSWN